SCHTDVDRIEYFQLRVRPATVDLGHGPDGRYAGLKEISSESQGHAFARVGVAMRSAVAQNGRQVGLEHRRYVRRGLQQTANHVLGDALADRRMRNATDVSGWGSR